MLGHRIKLDDELMEKVKQCASKAGYASPEEFVRHVVEREVARLLGPGKGPEDPEEEVKQRLQGLGYIE
jgi:predicted transcriptional regulator